MLRPVLLTFALLFVSSSAFAAPPKISKAQWEAVFGVKGDGQVPAPVKGLQRDMTPADAGKVLKGAEKPSKHGFAKLPVKGLPGVKQLELWYMKDRETKKVPTFLRSATLTLDPIILKDKPSYEALLEVLIAKYGPLPKTAKPDEYQITWVLGGGGTAQVWKVGKNLTFKLSY